DFPRNLPLLGERWNGNQFGDNLTTSNFFHRATGSTSSFAPVARDVQRRQISSQELAINFIAGPKSNGEIGSDGAWSFAVEPSNAANELRRIASGNQNLTGVDDASGCVPGPHPRGLDSCWVKTRFR